MLDRTHLRFFTRVSACAMVEDAGFEILRMERTFTFPGPALKRAVLKAWVKRTYLPELDRDAFFSPRHSLLDSLTNQFLILARVR
jgi:hypothetical protein